MPIFKHGKDIVPPWCEVEDFEFISLGLDDQKTLDRRGEHEAFVVYRG